MRISLRASLALRMKPDSNEVFAKSSERFQQLQGSFSEDRTNCFSNFCVIRETLDTFFLGVFLALDPTAHALVCALQHSQCDGSPRMLHDGSLISPKSFPNLGLCMSLLCTECTVRGGANGPTSPRNTLRATRAHSSPNTRACGCQPTVTPLEQLK